MPARAGRRKLALESRVGGSRARRSVGRSGDDPRGLGACGHLRADYVPRGAAPAVLADPARSGGDSVGPSPGRVARWTTNLRGSSSGRSASEASQTAVTAAPRLCPPSRGASRGRDARPSPNQREAAETFSVPTVTTSSHTMGQPSPSGPHGGTVTGSQGNLKETQPGGLDAGFAQGREVP